MSQAVWFWAERWAKHCIDRWRYRVQDTESVAESRYFWEDKPMTLWRGLFVGKQRAVYRQLQHAQYSGQTKTHHLILFYAEYLWSLNLNLAGWIAGLKEKLSANSFLVQCVCCAWSDFYSQDFSTWVSLSQLLRSCHVFKFNVCLPAKWLYQTRVFNTACF